MKKAIYDSLYIGPRPPANYYASGSVEMVFDLDVAAYRERMSGANPVDIATNIDLAQSRMRSSVAAIAVVTNVAVNRSRMRSVSITLSSSIILATVGVRARSRSASVAVGTNVSHVGTRVRSRAISMDIATAQSVAVSRLRSQMLSEIMNVDVQVTPTKLSAEVFDDFTGTNGTAITAHSPNWGAYTWISAVGVGQIQSNRLTFTAVGTGETTVAIAGTSYADCFVYGKLRMVQDFAGYRNRLIIRYTDASNFLFAQMTFDRLTIWRRQLGSEAQLAQAFGSFPAPTIYAMHFTASGNALSVRIGAIIANVTSTFNASAKGFGWGCFISDAGPAASCDEIAYGSL